MSNSCETCDKSFGSDQALQQHLRDSPVHKPTFSNHEAPQQHRRDSVVPRPTFDCEICNKSFGNEHALQQHLRNSIVHKTIFNCETCKKTFGSDEALQQHLRYSIVHKRTYDKSSGSVEALFQRLQGLVIHKPTFDCKSCDRYFDSEEAFQQHLQDSREHRLLSDWDTCPRSFGTIDVLNQHIQTSPVHSRPPIWCDTCQRSFRSDEALQQHLQSSQVHQIEQQHHNIETETKNFEMFPELHQYVLDAISGAMNSPKFNYDDDDDSFECADKTYPTNVMGNFTCNNHHRPLSWPSKRVAIVIRRYPGNEYNAVVYNQRCKSCNELGTLDLDENSYVERVAYRLKKWAGVVAVERPFYDEKTSPPHKSDLCEGCRAGYCRNNTVEREFESWDWDT